MAKDVHGGYTGKLVLLSGFSIAMGYVEAMVVVYLRMLLPLDQWKTYVRDIPSLVAFLQKYHVFWTEQTREVATIVMLLAVALMAGLTFREKLAYFLWTFALWDIFYYIWLYALIKWPQSLAVTDLLFLIPGPWLAPVYVPVLISCGMIILSMVLLRMGNGKSSGSSAGKRKSSSK
jgi:hypothetical protein